MIKRAKNIKFISVFILMMIIVSLGVFAKLTSKTESKAKVVTIHKIKDQYQLLVNNKPFYIKGAGLEFGNIQSLVQNGGNAFRTWRIDNGSQTGKEILDKAQECGLMVCMGIEIGRERHGFDYDDSFAVQKQYEEVKQSILELKDHPALLMWGIGNELNLRYSNNKVWVAVNDISKMIHQIDGNHPTTTMLAGGNTQMLKEVIELAPDLDLLSFQYYGSITNLPYDLKKANYSGPYIITEWGATGHWEVEKTSWGRPIEENSSIKANNYKIRYESVIQKDSLNCLGSFVFLWGQKQERTPTWYGMFLEDGAKTQVVDVMSFLWSGQWPKNRAPLINSFTLNDQNAFASIVLSKEQKCQSSVDVNHFENDNLVYKWEILREVPLELQSDGGDFEPKPESIISFDYKKNGEQFNFSAPENGEYRLFVYVKDKNGNAATANIPFLVK